MPYTYLRKNQYTLPTGDAKIDATLQELRAVSGRDWRVALYSVEIGFLWRKRKLDSYALFVSIGETLFGRDFAVCDFGGDALTFYVSREILLAYLRGALEAR